MSCPKCIAPKIDGAHRDACDQFVGFHGICHECGFAWILHDGAARRRIRDCENYERFVERKPVVLTVIDGGGDDECRFSAWLEGERP